jgi:hypothetical protein
MGEVEAGVVETLRQLGIENPVTAPEKLAIYLARALDSAEKDEVKASLSRELRLSLEDVKNQPESSGDFLSGLQSRQ